jgi:hypothetical protein
MELENRNKLYKKDKVIILNLMQKYFDDIDTNNFNEKQIIEYNKEIETYNKLQRALNYYFQFKHYKI